MSLEERAEAKRNMAGRRRVRWPAEWEPQSGVQLTWPHENSDWRGKLDVVEPCFVEIASAIAKREICLIAAVDPARVEKLLKAGGTDMDNLRLYQVPSTDVWARDHGAIAVYQDRKIVLLDFTFNGWGGRYDAELDDKITGRLHAKGAFGAVEIEQVDHILEGGSVESDGAGTILTTSSCLLSKARNARLCEQEIEGALRQYLGAQRVFWLSEGYQAGDDTDSHIDILARFCDPGTIVYVACDDPADEHYAALRAMEAELKTFKTRRGEPYTLVPLPMPANVIHDESGERLPASYANFLIVNGAVLAPVYADPSDEAALARLASCFPGRKIVPIDCRPLILQHGSLHCVTMQFPRSIPL